MKKEYNLKNLKKRQKKVAVDKSAVKVAISLRLDGSDLSDIKSEADRLGIPYQTLIGSILHRYINNELVDSNTVKILKKLKAS